MPDVTVECLTVGWLITLVNDPPGLVILVDKEPAVIHEQDEGLFVSAYDGQLLDIQWTGGRFMDTHSCGRESG
ncbi:MAG: hypothetical protein DWQ40_00345 [Actinobacteria bacterium]|nr:MAG: hypothetical protein DWQ40_00345 [Actinomycetota bacterium]REK35581.1 MAG: hypothetical protein DWQ20_06040 [Actinomycetota bacterium]